MAFFSSKVRLIEPSFCIYDIDHDSVPYTTSSLVNIIGSRLNKNTSLTLQSYHNNHTVIIKPILYKSSNVLVYKIPLLYQDLDLSNFPDIYIDITHINGKKIKKNMYIKYQFNRNSKLLE